MFYILLQELAQDFIFKSLFVRLDLLLNLFKHLCITYIEGSCKLGIEYIFSVDKMISRRPKTNEHVLQTMTN